MALGTNLFGFVLAQRMVFSFSCASRNCDRNVSSAAVMRGMVAWLRLQLTVPAGSKARLPGARAPLHFIEAQEGVD